MSPSKDEITVIIANVAIKVQRLSTIPIPHEITVVIPRAELRRSLYQNGQLVETTETILNSITISHAPRSENEKGASQNACTTWKYLFNNKDPKKTDRPPSR